MNKTPKISIIIPVYNVEDYLEECLVSVLDQTLREVEIIIINDQSPDNSGKIANKYATKDSRIIYIVHEVNKGQAMARNTGLNQASGEYICFLDSDDKLEANALQLMYDKAIENDLDILEGKFRTFNTEGDFDSSPSFRNTDVVYSGIEVFDKAYKEKFFFTMPVWKRIWKREFIERINFSFPSIYHEELIPLINAYLKADRIMYVNEIFYKYRIEREGSITNSCNLKQVEDFYTIYNYLSNLIKGTKNVVLRKFYQRRLANTMKILMERFLLLEDKYLSKFDQILKENKKCFLFMNTSRFVTRLSFYIGCINPSLFRRILRANLKN